MMRYITSLPYKGDRIDRIVQALEQSARQLSGVLQGGAKKRGHHLIANILKFHDRIAWKLVDFCNIIC